MHIEQDCTVEHEGKKYEASGSYLVRCSDGFSRGIVYAGKDCRSVTTWHGEKLADATFGATWQGNFCKMRCVSFTVDGVRYRGSYCPDWADAIKVKSTRKV